ncbi:MAG: hypothetical protein WB511_12865 [Nitrososphaeraceae archaeon]
MSNQKCDKILVIMVIAIILIFASSSGQLNYAVGEDMSDSTSDEIIITGTDPSDRSRKSNVPSSQPQDHSGSETLIDSV